MHETVGWARVWATIRQSRSRNLRRGAWYPVVRDDQQDRVHLGLNCRTVQVPRRILEIRPRRPDRFTIVRRTEEEPNPVRNRPEDLGLTYAVCPACRARVRVYGHPRTMTCWACRHRGEMAWWETG